MIVIDDFLKFTEFMDVQKNWEQTKYVSSIIDTDEARRILIHVLDIWDGVNDDFKSVWLDLIERAGFYPYFINKLDDQYEQSFQSEIRSSFFKSNNLSNVYFHEKQKEIEILLSRGRNVAVSAPTSFGKSLLIEENVAKNKFDNILIIQPTLALIDETRRKLLKYANDEYGYTIVVNTKQNVGERNIFILTSERVLEFPDLPMINFFVIDEFYKISNRLNDSRIDALNVALVRVMNMHPQAMFLTPTVKSLSARFRDKYSIDFVKTDYALVNTNVIEVRNKNGHVLNGQDKKRKLFELLATETGSSIVYVKSPNEAYRLANEYLLYYKDSLQVVNEELAVFDWMDENVSEDWQLKELIKHGVGAHNGALPRHLVSHQIDLFNEGKLNVLFATVSLIEGVNTVAKNMFIYSKNKGNKQIDFFDFANIKGRAGRMGKHFTGNVYLFEDAPENSDFIIDVPSVDQEKISDEILVNVADKDLRKEKLEEKKRLVSELPEELERIMKDNLINFRGQRELYDFIVSHRPNYLKWNQIPKYEQLWETLFLGYKYLENNDNMSFAKKQAVMALKFVNQSIKRTIIEQEKYLRENNKRDALNRAIDEIFKFQRNDANFKIPKLLAVVNSIAEFAFVENGIDYTTFAARLENEQINENFQFLIDYGVPSSAIKKIQNEQLMNENILEFINMAVENRSNNLNSYERQKLSEI